MNKQDSSTDEGKAKISPEEIPTPKPSLVKKHKIPTIMGVAVLVIGLVTGVVLVQREQEISTQATDEGQPSDVRITNITDSSFTVTWTTQTNVNGYVIWGERDNLTKTSSNNINSASTVHSSSITNLSPSTTYNFKIGSGEQVFENNGSVWSITTGPSLQSSGSAAPISGSVLLSNGQPASNAIVYVNIGGASPISTVTTSNGNWILPLSTIRSRDLSSYINPNEQETILEIFVQAGEHGIASATSYPATSRPLPALTIGMNEDFRNTIGEESSSSPSSELNLPKESSTSSRFKLDSETSIQTDTSVTLESLEDGEVISSTRPQFFGEGPPGTNFTITVESDPVTQEIEVGSSGSWSWSPPENLEEGTHKVTISWRDSGGILRTITRTFIVQASNDPAFEATSSAATSTPTPAPTQTSTPTPTTIATTTPKATNTPAPTLKPTITPLATTSPLPEAGISTYTLRLSMIGFMLLFTSSFAIVIIRRQK